MPRLTRSAFLRFAPAVLALSLVFVTVTDAAASCLAAWLCMPAGPPPCAHQSASSMAWEPGVDACGFERRVDPAAPRLDIPTFDVRPPAAAIEPTAPVARLLGIEAPPHPATGPPRALSQPLYRLQHVLLI
jgi:hypothetical protein